MNSEGKKSYDVVILLCACSLHDGSFDEFSPDASYLSGQLRMQAAVDISSEVGTFVIVGGIVDDDDEHKWTQVDDTRKYLIARNIEPDRVLRILSKTGTCGNLRATDLGVPVPLNRCRPPHISVL